MSGNFSGRYRSYRGVSVPSVCPEGSYCPESTEFGQQFLCPMGTYSNRTGLSSHTQCTPCDPGYYCSGPGERGVQPCIKVALGFIDVLFSFVISISCISMLSMLHKFQIHYLFLYFSILVLFFSFNNSQITFQIIRKQLSTILFIFSMQIIITNQYFSINCVKQ